jgi:ABC-type branched-subunit amino acid transport system substrate-binding protein
LARRLVAQGAVALAILAFGMAGLAVAEPGVGGDRILFGQVAALTGPAAALGQEMRQGLLAAFAEVNGAGGIKGRKLELISRDDGYEPTRSVEATKRTIEDDKVFALVGAVGTPTSIATQPIAASAGLPFIGAFSGAEFLREPQNSNVVNVRASYFQETETMVAHLTEDRGVTRIAILYQDDAFGRAGLMGVQRALDRRAMKLVSEGRFERNTIAVKMALFSIRKGNPEAVIMIGSYRPCAAFIKLARQQKLDAQFVNISFVDSDALAGELGPGGAGVIVTQVVPFPGDSSIPLVSRYRSALKSSDPDVRPGFVTLEGYLVGRLVIAALEKIEGEPTRLALLNAIVGSTFDLGGVTLSYGLNDNRGSDQVFLTVIQPDGSFKAVKTLDRVGG